jgi:hypothetical protein
MNTKLEGSEKQIAWAESIRTEKIEEITNYIERTEKRIANGTNVEHNENQLTKANKALEIYQKETSAKWFIVNREVMARDFMKKL